MTWGDFFSFKVLFSCYRNHCEFHADCGNFSHNCAQGPITTVLHWLNGNVVLLHDTCSSDLVSKIFPALLASCAKMLPDNQPPHCEITPPDHPIPPWTCRWIKWPTALILHIKNKKKKVREGEDVTVTSLSLCDWTRTGPKEQKKKRWGWKREGVHMMTFSFHIPSSQHRYKRRMDDR